MEAVIMPVLAERRVGSVANSNDCEMCVVFSLHLSSSTINSLSRWEGPGFIYTVIYTTTTL
jgi:hypothetical protein